MQGPREWSQLGRTPKRSSDLDEEEGIGAVLTPRRGSGCDMVTSQRGSGLAGASSGAIDGGHAVLWLSVSKALRLQPPAPAR